MITIGIDPSIAATGIVVLRNDKVVLEVVLETSKMKKPNINTNEDVIRFKIRKLLNIYVHILRILKNYKPDYIAIEGYSYAGIRNLTSQAEVTGIILLAIEKYNIVEDIGERRKAKILIIQPTQLKKFITGKGIGKKELMLKEVFKKFNYDTDNNNLADAFCLAKVANYYPVKNRIGLTKDQDKIVSSLDNLKKKKGRKKDEIYL